MNKTKFLVVVGVAAIFLSVGRGVYQWIFWARPEFRSFDTPAIVIQVRQLKQLTTVKYTVQRVVGLTEQKIPLGAESLLLMVQCGFRGMAISVPE